MIRRVLGLGLASGRGRLVVSQSGLLARFLLVRGRRSRGIAAKLLGQAHLAGSLVQSDGELGVWASRGGHEWTQGGVRSEDAIVGVAVSPWRWDEGCQPVEQFEGAEQDVISAVDVSGRELVDKGFIVDAAQTCLCPG